MADNRNKYTKKQLENLSIEELMRIDREVSVPSKPTRPKPLPTQDPPDDGGGQSPFWEPEGMGHEQSPDAPGEQVRPNNCSDFDPNNTDIQNDIFFRCTPEMTTNILENLYGTSDLQWSTNPGWNRSKVSCDHSSAWCGLDGDDYTCAPWWVFTDEWYTGQNHCPQNGGDGLTYGLDYATPNASHCGCAPWDTENNYLDNCATYGFSFPINSTASEICSGDSYILGDVTTPHGIVTHDDVDFIAMAVAGNTSISTVDDWLNQVGKDWDLLLADAGWTPSAAAYRQFLAGDVDGDGGWSAVDVSRIFQYVDGIIDGTGHGPGGGYTIGDEICIDDSVITECLIDFSYAGYHLGEEVPDAGDCDFMVEIPSSYDCTNSLTEDCLSGIHEFVQEKIDDVVSGTICLPDGLYVVRGDIQISSDGIILKGQNAGDTTWHDIEDDPTGGTQNGTRLYFVNDNWPDSPMPKIKINKSSIVVPTAYEYSIQQDVLIHEMYVELEYVYQFDIGDEIFIGIKKNDNFVNDHNMDYLNEFPADWFADNASTPLFYRKITGIDTPFNKIYFDVPIRYTLPTTWSPYVIKTDGNYIRESGVQDIDISNAVRYPLAWKISKLDILGDVGQNIDYKTNAAASNAAHIITMDYAQDCFIKNVNTFSPDEYGPDLVLTFYGIDDNTMEEVDMNLLPTSGTVKAADGFSSPLIGGTSFGGENPGYGIPDIIGMSIESINPTGRHEPGVSIGWGFGIGPYGNDDNDNNWEGTGDGTSDYRPYIGKCGTDGQHSDDQLNWIVVDGVSVSTDHLCDDIENIDDREHLYCKAKCINECYERGLSHQVSSCDCVNTDCYCKCFNPDIVDDYIKQLPIIGVPNVPVSPESFGDIVECGPDRRNTGTIQEYENHEMCPSNKWCHSSGICVDFDTEFCVNNECYQGDGDCDVVDGIENQCMPGFICGNYDSNAYTTPFGTGGMDNCVFNYKVMNANAAYDCCVPEEPYIDAESLPWADCGPDRRGTSTIQQANNHERCNSGEYCHSSGICVEFTSDFCENNDCYAGDGDCDSNTNQCMPGYECGYKTYIDHPPGNAAFVGQWNCSFAIRTGSGDPMRTADCCVPINTDPLEARHLISGGIWVKHSRNITVENCRFQLPQNRGGGGNGYMFDISTSNEVLFKTCEGYRGRHNFVASVLNSGIVYSDVKTSGGRVFLNPGDDYISRYRNQEIVGFGMIGLSDTHRILNMGMLVTNSKVHDGWKFSNRNTKSNNAGQTSVNSVIWNVSAHEDTDPYWMGSSIPGSKVIQSYQHAGLGFVLLDTDEMEVFYDTDNLGDYELFELSTSNMGFDDIDTPTILTTLAFGIEHTFNNMRCPNIGTCSDPSHGTAYHTFWCDTPTLEDSDRWYAAPDNGGYALMGEGYVVEPASGPLDTGAVRILADKLLLGDISLTATLSDDFVFGFTATMSTIEVHMKVRGGTDSPIIGGSLLITPPIFSFDLVPVYDEDNYPILDEPLVLQNLQYTSYSSGDIELGTGDGFWTMVANVQFIQSYIDEIAGDMLESMLVGTGCIEYNEMTADEILQIVSCNDCPSGLIEPVSCGIANPVGTCSGDGTCNGDATLWTCIPQGVFHTSQETCQAACDSQYDGSTCISECDEALIDISIEYSEHCIDPSENLYCRCDTSLLPKLKIMINDEIKDRWGWLFTNSEGHNTGISDYVRTDMDFDALGEDLFETQLNLRIND